MTAVSTDTTGLPAFPGEHNARCPFDPPGEYTQWRKTVGLRRAVWKDTPVWVVSRHEDIRAALADHRMSADTGELQSFSGIDNPPPVFPRMDDPEHARLRRMFTKDFTVKRVNSMRPQIEKMAHQFIDQLISKGHPADLVRDYALPIPSLVISLMLGVPYKDHEFFQRHSTTMSTIHATKEDKGEAAFALFGYLQDLVARKEAEPGDDLISRVLREHVATDELDRVALVMNGLILLFAGHETTANAIALATLALLRNPDQAARMRETDDPAVLATAVEELLRYLPIVHALVARIAKDDVEIAGQHIKAGEVLLMNLPAGNRDAAFVPDPDTLYLDRHARGHLGFGYGIHQCLGQTLARAEMQVALPVLLRRLPDLRLAVPFEELRFRHDMNIYGVHELPVAW
ncbi:cytochrome P450 [Nocardia sp. CA-120079]|uniref:cytochrome P450 n=1 Tax=Nocardia sp. CA-120079 TaxID=3239974 RepID=UPI003D98314F